MRHVETKQEFYKLSRQLLLGNIIQQWTWDEFAVLYEEGGSQLPDIVGIRHVRPAFTNKGNSGLFPKKKAYEYGKRTPDKQNLLFDEGAIHDHLTIQGEVMTTEAGLYVRYSHLQCHQRTLWYIEQHGLKGLESHQLPHNPELLTAAQREGRGGGVVKHAQGLLATSLLQKYMDDRSWDMMSQILSCQRGKHNTFGDSVMNFWHPIVEFACFDRPTGVLGWNTIFWEVRTRY